MEEYKKLKNRLKGVIVPMITPFKNDQKIDEDGVRKLTRYLIDSGIKEGNGALILTGSSGECPMLNDEERKKIFSIVKEEAKEEVPILGGCNHTDPRTVIKLVNYAEEVGLDGVMIGHPYYWKPSDEDLLTFFKTIAKETNLGIMVYNNWFASQYDMSVEVITKMVDEIPKIISLKDNTPYIAKFAKVVESVGDKIAIQNGMGPSNEPWAAVMGAKGLVTAEAALIPKTLVEMYKAECKKDYKDANNTLKKAAVVLDFLLGGVPWSHDYIRRLKAAMNFVGLPGGVPRLPLLALDEKFKLVINNVIKDFKLDEVWNKK